MTIDEAIRRAKDKAEHYYSMIDVYHTDEGIYLEEETRSRIYAEEQEQLAEWLEELKAWRSGEKSLVIPKEVFEQMKIQVETKDGEVIGRMINKFIGQYRSEERLATKYDAGRITKNGDQFCIGYEMGGAEETFSVGQPIYDKDFNLMGYLGIGLWEHLDYACDMKIPVEVWTVCLPTEHCIEGKHVYTYWQMLELKGEQE